MRNRKLKYEKGHIFDNTRWSYDHEVAPRVAYYNGVKNTIRMFSCVCSCGTQKIVQFASLRNSRSKSCGCHKKENWLTRVTTHGNCKDGVYTRLYTCWKAMKQRCYNPANKYYHNYGGRGITICDEWFNNFEIFATWAMANNYKPDLTIDRKHNSKNYTPSNCRFVKKRKNGQNTYQSKWWVIHGKVYNSISEAADMEGIGRSTVRNWCVGRVRNNKFTPPLHGCYSVPKYIGNKKNTKPKIEN